MSTTLIEIQVNGEARAVPAEISIEEMLISLDLQPAMIVVEHNGEILRRDRDRDVQIAAGDSFELVHFVGGG